MSIFKKKGGVESINKDAATRTAASGQTLHLAPIRLQQIQVRQARLEVGILRSSGF